MGWEPASEKLIEFIEEDLEKTVVQAKFAKLPFYEDGYLVEAETLDGVEHVVLGGLGGVSTCVLDGNSCQIRVANHIGVLKLRRDNVGEYTRFFCDHLRAADGFFRIVDDAEGQMLDTGHRLRDMRIKVRHQEADGSFRVGAFIHYDDQLMRVSFRVDLNGHVDMLRDLKLGQFITAKH